MPDARPADSITQTIVVGAGAAGMATAIFARQFNPSRPVVLLDGARKPGAKILISGGSRCNVTNREVTERDFWGGRATIIRRVLAAFTASDAVAFFRDLGVTLHEEPGGKLFPDSNRSRDVLTALLRRVSDAGVTLLTEHRVVDVVPATGGFRLVTSRGELHARSVVLATGGRSLPKTGSDGTGLELARRLGHTIVPTTPALTPLLLDERASFHREVAGVSQDVQIAIWLDGAIATRLDGAILWTHFGVSGPVAMNASRHWLRAETDGRRVAVTLSFCPGQTLDDVDARLRRGLDASPKASVHTLVSSIVPASVVAAMLPRIAIDGGTTLAHLTRDDRRRLARALVEWPLPVTGARGYNHAEATAGGVALDEADPATLQSRRCPGLYLAGEMLDVDGRIGGFNFQWAWSTGFVAGRAVAARPA